MKSLFRKIGKGLSNIGKAIGKVFNSKVGRVIGTLSLAAGMFGLFKVLAGSTSTAASAGSTLAGTSTGTTVPAATSGVTTATTGAGTAAATTTTVGSASAGTSAATTATQLGGASAVSPITTEAVTDTVTEAALEAGTKTISTEINTLADVDRIGMNMQQQLQDAAATGKVDVMSPTVSETTTKGLEFYKDASTAKDLPGYETYGNQLLENYGKTKDVTSSDIDMFVRSKQRSKDFADYLANTENREAYDVFAKKYDLQPSNAYARQEFASLQDAINKGEGFFDTTGNVIQYGLEADITSVTGGEYTGFGGTSNVARTTATTASLLTPPEEPPEPPNRPNLYASSIASSQLDAAEATAALPTMSQTVQLNNSISNGANPMQTLNSIRSNAGYSQVYGPYFSMSS
jgi:hypothetical protein